MNTVHSPAQQLLEIGFAHGDRLADHAAAQFKMGTTQRAIHLNADGSSNRGNIAMQGNAPVGWILFFTLAAGVFIIAGLFIRFLHSHRNREIAANALAGQNSPRVGATPKGALPGLAGAVVFALIAMGLLAFGYSHKSSVKTAQTPPPVAGGSMTQPVGTADRPKVYQPVNPTPDPKSGPTTTNTGTENGDRPEDEPKR